jgi:hypothetical protein
LNAPPTKWKKNMYNNNRFVFQLIALTMLSCLLAPSMVNSEPITVFGAVHLSISVKDQDYRSNTPIVLEGDRHDDWIMLSNGAIVLANHRLPGGGYLGLTILNQSVHDGTPIILHEGYNTWRFADDSTIRVTDPDRKNNPDSDYGLKVNSQVDGEPLVLGQEDLNLWIRGSAPVLDHLQRRFKRERQILNDREHSIVMMYEDDSGWKGGGDKWRVQPGEYSNKGRGGYAKLPVENDEVRSLIIPANYRVHLTDDDSFKPGSHGQITKYGPVLLNINKTKIAPKLAGKVSSIGIYYVPPVPPNRTRPAFSVKCADEGEQCEFSGVQRVWYGAGRSYVSESHTDGAACSPGSFRDIDPYPYTRKSCYLEQEQLPYGAIKCAIGTSDDDKNECKILNPIGDTTVYYGSTVAGDDMYFSRVFSQFSPGEPAVVKCTEKSFAGNPVPFHGKNCYLAPKPRPPTATKCADEGENCTWPETATGIVWYGAENSYAAKRFSNRQSIPCVNAVFGDPVQGTRKACYIKSN